MSEEKTQIFVDASSLKESSCERRLVYNNFYGFRPYPFDRNFKTGYGSAFHRALEYWYGSAMTLEDEKIALQKAADYYQKYTPYIGADDYRTPLHLHQSLEAYFVEYNKDTEVLHPIKGVISPGLLECKFTYPAVLFDECLASPYFELIIAGTIDMIASYMGEEIFVDHKSTGSWFSKKDEFFGEFEISVQMFLYKWVLKRLTGQDFRFMINGIFIKKCTDKSAKEGLFDGVNFERYGPRDFTPNQMVIMEGWLRDRLLRFHRWLSYKYEISQHDPSNVASLTSHDPSSITTPDFSACFPKWGCPYIKVCSQSPENQRGILGMINREAYEPLKFGE